MKEQLLKLNFIKNHNHIVRLKKENEKKDLQIKKIVNEYKDLVTDYRSETKKNKERLEQQIKELQVENDNLKAENIYYKEIFKKIPKVIIKIFAGRNNKLLLK